MTIPSEVAVAVKDENAKEAAKIVIRLESNIAELEERADSNVVQLKLAQDTLEEFLTDYKESPTKAIRKFHKKERY